MSNLELWNKVEKTNPAHTKKCTVSGHTFTAIDAYHQIKNATELWGPYGKDWGFTSRDIDMIDGGENILALFMGTFKYPDGSFPISTSILVRYKTSSNYIKVDSEFAKKLETDAITKALSRLGFNADVFLGRFDDNKYVASMREEFSSKESKTEEPKDDISIDEIIRYLPECKSIKSLEDYYKKNRTFIESRDDEDKAKIMDAFANRKSQIEGEKK